MQTIALTNEQWEALQSGEPVTIQPHKPKQWEPQPAEYWFDIKGATRKYPSRTLAEQAAERMIKANRLSTLVDEIDPDWKADWDYFIQNKFYLIYDHQSKKWESANNSYIQRIESVYMSRRTADKICAMLNSGEVIL